MTLDNLKMNEDTICAISTARGVGGISVIRVSGPQAKDIVSKLCPFLPSECESHRVYYGFIKKLDKTDIDEALVSYFAEGRSFTGEQTLEISSHGGYFIGQSLITELQKSGARMANRGEFTYRAFMNGRMDLSQAEGVLAMIESQSQTSSQLALKQLKGHLSQTFKSIEERLIYILAHLEADIDFSSEDIEYSSGGDLLLKALDLQLEINQVLSTYKKGRQIREGVDVSIIGEPNVGKSSLFNTLLGEDRAIVSTQVGTTRDCIEGMRTIEGVCYYFKDTAGLRKAQDEVEKMGIERTLNSSQDSDLIFLTFDLSKEASNFSEGDIEKMGIERTLNSSQDVEGIILNSPLEKLYFIFNKSDLVPPGEHIVLLERRIKEISKRTSKDEDTLRKRCFLVSATQSQGIRTLLLSLEDFSTSRWAEDSVIITQARHFELLKAAQERLSAAIDLLKKEVGSEFTAFELQDSLSSVQQILGKQYDDEVMDRVFKDFCLGK